MHSMWKGTISFGLVMIPVRLYAATEQKDISFRQVHRADGGRIKFRRFCSVCGEEVRYEDVAKGYELPSGEMVVLADEDMADLPLPSTKSIEVLHFAPAEQLDPILFNRSYYVEPETAGARAYVLLRDALERSGRVAVAQVALRQRESLATLRSREGVLVLETLLWPDEVRAALFPFLQEEIEVRAQELTMAGALIDSMTADFDPGAHKDGYREALAELVEAKVQGRELLQPGTLEIAAGPAVSLADALKASLAAAQEGSAAGQNVTKGKAVGTGSGAAKAIETGSGKPAGSARAKASSAAAGPAKTGPAKTGSARSGSARAAKADRADTKPEDDGSAKPEPAKRASAKAGPARRKPTG
ncbi:MAG TPA: Ku protein [Streptosporangiaceae bacterium]|nr:Ku protein [Streptosporangiaceae bacterium]